MPNTFATVRIAKTKGHFTSGIATVPGIDDITASSREEFCRVAGHAIFERHPVVTSIGFVGPGRTPEVRITRDAILS